MPRKTVRIVAPNQAGCRNPGCGKRVLARDVCGACYYWLNAADKPACSVAGCGRLRKSGDLCSLHYDRKLRHGDPLIQGRPHAGMGCNDGPCRIDGCQSPARKRGLCRRHLDNMLRCGDPLVDVPKPGPKGWLTADGYRMVPAPNGHPNARRANKLPMIAEHRLVMSQILGRALRAGEIVHHKNGNRLDNRPENLELCVGFRQPPNQRVADLVKFARQVLLDYGDLVDRMKWL